ncbi:MAG TPA: radical SAM protein [Dehalococcoidia bacterium]
MLSTYRINGEEIDSLELKILLITKGINIPSDEVYERFGNTHRLSSFRDPGACNCLLLPDNTVVHIWNAGPRSPFTVGIAESGNAYLAYKGRFVTEVGFPQKTQFYEQYTSRGIPFGMIAVLQGLDVLSFPYLWPCEYAKSGFPCQFCYTGAYTEGLAREGKLEFLSPTPQDVAEVVNYAVNIEKLASYIQITGGSTMTPRAECHLVCDMLRAIDDLAGLDNIAGEVLVYTSPPSDPVIVEKVFRAGADRVACDMEIWDEELFQHICPGKARFAGRERQLDVLVHIARKTWS